MKATTVNGRSHGTAARRAEVVRRVHDALTPYQPRGYRLVADAESMEKRGDDWLVVVTPDREDASLGDAVTRMMAAEESLRRRWNMNITLLPAMPPVDD